MLRMTSKLCLIRARVAKGAAYAVSTRVATTCVGVFVCVCIRCVYVPNVLRPKYLAKCICSCLCNSSPEHVHVCVCMCVCVCMFVCMCVHLLWPRAWKSSAQSQLPRSKIEKERERDRHRERGKTHTASRQTATCLGD